jgi:leucoanthocyanidin reductase
MKYLIFGYGNFASAIVRRILTDNNDSVILYLRQFSVQKRADDLDQLKSRHVDRVSVVVGEVSDEDTIRQTVIDLEVDIVICALAISRGLSYSQAYSHVLEELHIINAIKNVSTLKRYIPSEFGHLSSNDLVALGAAKHVVRKTLAQSDIPYTSIFCGRLMDIVPAFPKACYDTNNAIYLTLMDDLARMVPVIATDERTVNKAVYVHGDKLTQAQILSVLGTDVKTLPLVTEAELKKTLEERKQQDQPAHMEGAIYTLFFTGDGSQLGDAIDYKELYPQEKLSTFQQAVEQNKFAYSLNK